MRNAIVVALGLGVLASCGASPLETSLLLRAHAAWCDKLHSTLSDNQKTVPFNFYLGKNAGDCKAAYDEALADQKVNQNLGNRTVSQTEADKCIEGITKLAQQDVLNLLSSQIDSTGPGANPGMQMTARTDALAKLGLAMDFSCAPNGACRADPGCSLAANSGPCSIIKVAPLKDGNLAAAENNAYTMPMSTAGCGIMAGFTSF